jgi:hypothetical protein
MEVKWTYFNCWVIILVPVADRELVVIDKECPGENDIVLHKGLS